MMTQNEMATLRKIYVKDLNPCITCNLCNGYLIEATTLVDCLHVFCRACILRYFENSKMGCPTCNTVYKKKNFPCFRPDPIIQSLVYKLVPSLYSKEVQRRDDFYRSTAMRASSSCSEDSVIGDLSQEHEEWISSNIDDQFQFFSPEDSVSLSLEYYQPQLDQSTDQTVSPEKTLTNSVASDLINSYNASDKKTDKTNEIKTECLDSASEKSNTTDSTLKNNEVSDKDLETKRDRRYLQCPAAVTMSHLQKFIRMKYALGLEHKVDIIYSGEVLPQYFSLMDVAYTFKWQRQKPMRFFYRIFTPIRIQPFKIIKTTSNGEKQLQIVPLKQQPPELVSPVKEENKKIVENVTKSETDAEVQNNINKENLLAQLNLKSKAKIEQEQQLASANSTKTLKPNSNRDAPPKLTKSVGFKDLNLRNLNQKDSSSKTTSPRASKDVLKVASVKIDTKPVYDNQPKTEKVKKIYDPDKNTKPYEPEDIDMKLSKLYEKKQDQTSAKYNDHGNHQPANKDLKLVYFKSITFDNKTPKRTEDSNCIYEYEERDEDEIRKFAEKRDREWALQKQKDEEEEKYRSSKKRKKSKHSKSDFVHKKRKLHAEITSNDTLNKEEPLKLKVKLTPHNGHKHKHHKNSQNNFLLEPTSPKQQEMSSKEKLLQMRQVRHKNIQAEKTQQEPPPTPTTDSSTNVSDKSTQSDTKPKEPEPKIITLTNTVKPTTVEQTTTERKTNVSANKTTLTQSKNIETNSTQTINNNNKIKDVAAGPPVSKNETLIVSGKTLRSDFSIKTNASQELSATRFPTVKLEKQEHIDRQATEKTYLKTFQSYTEKLAESVAQKADLSKMMNSLQNRISSCAPIQQNRKSPLERKIANLHQQQNAVDNKPKQAQQSNKTTDKKASGSEKPQTILNSQYTTGFTVSKIEAGTKRKLENIEDEQDKRPSLEITLIDPPVTVNSPSQMQKSKTTVVDSKTGIKRPPPATIPLERIKKSINLKSGISIIPKLSETQGPLDLSSPGRHPEMFIAKPPNGMTGTTSGSPKTQSPASSPKNANTQERVKTPDKNIQLSNLQMLSKVALEHSNITKTPVPTLLNITKKPNIPMLQTIKIPVPKSPNLARLPKLNEINKTTFRMMNPQMRNMRPNQNQNIRNIPNPSLLVRQQTQNRLNSLNTTQKGNGESSNDNTSSGGVKPNNNDTKNSDKNDRKVEESTGQKPVVTTEKKENEANGSSKTEEKIIANNS